MYSFIGTRIFNFFPLNPHTYPLLRRYHENNNYIPSGSHHYIGEKLNNTPERNFTLYSSLIGKKIHPIWESFIEMNFCGHEWLGRVGGRWCGIVNCQKHREKLLVLVVLYSYERTEIVRTFSEHKSQFIRCFHFGNRLVFQVSFILVHIRTNLSYGKGVRWLQVTDTGTGERVE